ncbi:YbaB/EbfC family nucleoid-associated protein [Actinokineospora inagensis]|uniref:YbaB/EbfC family nucleoid-associated protein n=1 Tax=Actinokineospora inagensis TaxID=103730 RepID=UPI000429EBD8|nr:YbaB/EbfC family nucleoid-associated protein [Actinokineospora inagensis]
MSVPPNGELAAALAELREQQGLIAAALRRSAEVTTVVTSTDRVVEATVDGQGQLVEVRFISKRWRSMPPAQLCARVVEAVTKAQRESAVTTQGIFADVLPGGVVPNGFGSSTPDEVSSDIAAMFDTAITDAERMWTR